MEQKIVTYDMMVIIMRNLKIFIVEKIYCELKQTATSEDCIHVDHIQLDDPLPFRMCIPITVQYW